MKQRTKPAARIALAFLAGVLVGVLALRYSQLRGQRTVTICSLSPDENYRICLVELATFIDRNFVLTLERRSAGERNAPVEIFHSPDEGRPIGSERIIWSEESGKFLLIGRHFLVDQTATLPGGDQLYLLYDVRTGELRCNSTQQSEHQAFGLQEVREVQWEHGAYDKWLESASDGEAHDPGPAGEPWRCHVIDDSSLGADGVRLADVNGDGLPDIATGWEEGGITRVYLNPGHAGAEERWPLVTVGSTPSVEDAVFMDLDSDGSMDVVSCCEGKTRTVFIHWAPQDAEDYMVPSAWKQAPIPSSQGKMQWMFACPMQVDGNSGIDIVAGGKGKDAEIGWFEAPSDPRRLGDYTWHPISPVGWVMSIIAEDMDGDGDRDIAISDRYGTLQGCRWLENPGPGPDQVRPWPNHRIGAEDREVMFMTLADLDQDGMQDVLAAVKKSDVLWFRRLDASGTSWEERTVSFPENTGTAKAVAVGDLDEDGTSDIVVSCEQAEPPKSGVVGLSRETSSGGWVASDVSGPRGIKFDRLELLDLDGDGDLDVLTCEEREGGRGLGVVWYENSVGAE